MRIEQLQHFIEVAKCQSLSQAADNLFIGKSTLSNSINSLENELQRELFIRTSKGTYLSDFGKSIISHAEQIIKSNQKISDLSKINHSGNNQLLYINSYPVGAISSVLGLLDFLHQHFPEANVVVSQTHSESVVSDLTTSGHSIGVVASSFLTHTYIKENAENHDFIFEPVYEDSLSVFVNKKHLLSTSSSLTIDQLVNDPIIIYRRFVSPDTNTFYHDFRKLKHLYSVENYELIKKSLRNPHLVSIAPTLTFYEDFNAGEDNIVQIPIIDCSVTLTVSLVYKKDFEKMSDLEIEAIKYLRAYYQKIKAQK